MPPDENLPTLDEKASARNAHPPRPPRTEPSWMETLRYIAMIFCTGALLLLAFRHSFPTNQLPSPGDQSPPVNRVEKGLDLPKVELEAHGMSRCPDFRDCLRELIVPTMIQVGDKVNFTLSFIGRIDSQSDAVSCMHGPAECLGNIIELCAAEVYPDPKIYLGFANCLASDYHDIPNRDLVEGCAMEHGIDFQKLNSCISDEGEGLDLLRASIQRSQENNVTKSCTVRLAGSIRCIRDGGKWYDCPGGASVEDLVQDINALYER